MSYTYEYPKADITADIVVLREKSFGLYDVLLIKRGDNPFKGCFALPGGYVNVKDERIHDAAMRELNEELGIDGNKFQSHFVGYFDKPDRDTRGRVITFAWYIVVPEDIDFKAGDDAASAEWVSTDIALDSELAFDHVNILNEAVYLADSRRF